ncbi:MAG: hypothetical protein ACREV1_06430, partial [Gammaproteobacteria bacterium]
MAVDFNGTTSKIQHDTADLGITNLVTICAWSFAQSLGEVAGAIVSIDENFNSCVFFNHPTTTDTLRFSTIVAGTDG